MKKLLLVLLLLVLAVGTAVFLFFKSNLSPVSADTSVKTFVVNPGDGAGMISSRLEKNHLINNALSFLLLAHLRQANNNLQAGSFRLSPSMSSEEILTKLTSGGSDDYWLKIVDGQRVEEISSKFGLSVEGYLYPDSYLIPKDYSVDQILAVIKANFDKKFSQAKAGATADLSDAEAVTLASLIEREARTAESKKMVSGVLTNRLKIGMPLQLDATIQYARDTQNHPSKYWLPLNSAEIHKDSAFNTYLHPGLPPSPICNPGYDSLYAAFHPSKTEALYYITGKDNQMHFATTLDGHNANIAKYLK